MKTINLFIALVLVAGLALVFGPVLVDAGDDSACAATTSSDSKEVNPLRGTETCCRPSR